MSGRSYRKGAALYTAIAVIILVFLEMYVFADRKPGGVTATQATVAIDMQAPVAMEPVQAAPVKPSEPFGPPKPDEDAMKPKFSPPLEMEMMAPMLPFKAYEAEVDKIEPAWIKNAADSDVPKDKPRIAIIIDDMGMDRKHTREIMDLPGPLTLAFLPYAGDLASQTRYGHDKGHELMVHVPMEPVKDGLNAGPDVLKPGMTAESFMATLKKDLESFDGYVGINNHMGSKMTQDRAGMEMVMRELDRRGLLFVDSKTINSSVAADEARKAGIPYAERDVFIDNEETYESATTALQEVEHKALKSGLAIAIGHPREETVHALRAWLPTLKDKGIYLIPISEAVTVPDGADGDPDLRDENVR